MGFLAAVRLLRLPKAFLCAIAGVVILTALSTALFGVESWVRFLTQIIPHQFERVAHGEPTLIGKQVTPALGYGLTGQVFFAALAILLLTRCFNVFTAATATFLIAPYGFHYDMPAATLGFAYLLSDPEARAWRRVACAVAFCTPALAANSALIAPPVLLLGLFAQTEEWRVRADLPSSMQRHTDLALADLALGFRQRVFRRAFF